MTTAPLSLILDLVEWVAIEPRPYSEVMSAWRTSCPRLTVWEDSLDARLITRSYAPGEEAMILVTPEGLEFLARYGRTVADTR